MRKRGTGCTNSILPETNLLSSVYLTGGACRKSSGASSPTYHKDGHSRSQVPIGLSRRMSCANGWARGGSMRISREGLDGEGVSWCCLLPTAHPLTFVFLCLKCSLFRVLLVRVCVCVCARVCACARALVCVCACAHAAVLGHVQTHDTSKSTLRPIVAVPIHCTMGVHAANSEVAMQGLLQLGWLHLGYAG